MEQHEIRVSGAFSFEPSTQLRASIRSADRLLGEYEDGTTLEIIHDPAARWTTLRCNRGLWMQMTPAGKLIITTLDGPDHSIHQADESPGDGPKRITREV